MNASQTHEIAKDHWPAYFSDLGRQYPGWGTSVEVLDRQMGDQRVASDLPLQGFSFETAGSQAGDLLIEMGEANAPFETHLVRRPLAVRAAVMEPGLETDIQIESEDGVTTLVRLRRRRELPA